MTTDPNTIEVTKTEIHYWPACPCPVCEQARQDHGKATPTNDPIRRLTPDQAHTLGYIGQRNPLGSYARQLMTEQG